jgi:hypothetical protein
MAVDAGLCRFIVEQACGVEIGLLVWAVTRALEKRLELRRKETTCPAEKTSTTGES